MENPNSAESYQEGWPTISVDRAVAHLINGINIDLPKLVEFYNSLPHTNKPPLEYLHIHISASECYIFNVYDNLWTPLCGYFNYGTYGTYPDELNPEISFEKGHYKPILVLNVGTIMQPVNDLKDPQILTDSLNTYLAHELVHYAQGRKNRILIFGQKIVHLMRNIGKSFDEISRELPSQIDAYYHQHALPIINIGELGPNLAGTLAKVTHITGNKIPPVIRATQIASHLKLSSESPQGKK